jgi:hypothetical protein
MAQALDPGHYSDGMSNTLPRPAAISIDFGTSHTVATIRRADGRVHQQLFDGTPQLPSAVFMNDEGGPVVGADAVHSGRRKPERYEPNPKRRIDDASILLGETDIPVTSVIAAVLSRVARECEQTLGALGPVTVTVPAAWGPTRRHVVADAAAAAGLGRVDLVAEPVAAASYFVETLAIDVRPGSGVVVYDLGGGTFDATVLRRSANGFDVLAVDGADDLGGLDFDQALAEHLAATVQPDDDRWARLTNPSEPADLRHRTAFMEEVRQAKERLSRSASTELTIPLLDVDAHLTRDELEQVCKPLVERTLRVTQGVIRESGLAKEQVTALFLVGAASRMPLVATLLHREIGIAPAAIEQPELAVSEGGLVAQHTVSTPVSVPSPALPPQTAPVAMAAPSPAVNQAVQPPHHSAPRPPSQPTPQGLAAMPGPVSPPYPPAHMTGHYQQPAPPPRPGPWIKSKQGVAALSVAAVVVVLALGALVAFQFLPDRDTGDIAAENEQPADAGDGEADPSDAAEADDEDGSAATGDDDGLVPLDQAVLGDQVTAMDQAHTGAVHQVRTGQIDGVPVAVSAGEDKLVRVWNLETGEETATFRGHKEPVTDLSIIEHDGRSVAFSRDGLTEAVWYLDDPEHPINVREAPYYDTVFWTGVWQDIPAYVDQYEFKQLFTGEVMDSVNLAYSDLLGLTEVDGTLRQVGVHDGSVFVADMLTGEPVGGTFDQLSLEITAFTYGTAAGKTLGVTVTADGSIQAWDLAAAEPYGAAATELYQAVQAVRLTEVDGRAVAVVYGEKGLSAFDLETGAQLGETFALHSGEEALSAAAVGEIDGRPVVLVGTASGLVEVWSL